MKSRYERLKEGHKQLMARVNELLQRGKIAGYTPIYMHEFPDIVDHVLLHKNEKAA